MPKIPINEGWQPEFYDVALQPIQETVALTIGTPSTSKINKYSRHQFKKSSSWKHFMKNCISFKPKYIIITLVLIGLTTLIMFTVGTNLFRTIQQIEMKNDQPIIQSIVVNNTKQDIVNNIQQDIVVDLNNKQSPLKYYQHKNDFLNATAEMKQFQNDNFHKFTSKLNINELSLNQISMVHHDPEQDIYVSSALSQGKFWEQTSVSKTIKHVELILKKYSINPCNNNQDKSDCNTKIINKLGFLDIGANIGVYSVPLGKYFQDRYPFISIFSFEPLWYNYMLLSKSLELNEISNVYLYPYGLTNEGDFGDTTSFVIDAKNKGHSHIEGEHSWSEWDGETIQIQTLPLNWMLKQQNFNPKSDYNNVFNSFRNVLWMKIDTEGFEKFVFLGGDEFFADYKAGAPCFIRTEYWDFNRQEIFDTLTEKYGYFLAGSERTFNWGTIEQKEVPNNILKTDTDVIFVKRDVKKCIQHKINTLFQK